MTPIDAIRSDLEGRGGEGEGEEEETACEEDEAALTIPESRVEPRGRRRRRKSGEQ